MIGTHVWLVAQGAGTAKTDIDVNLAGAADKYLWTIIERCVVIRVGMILTATPSTNNAIVVEFDRLPHSVASREDAFATLTIPTTATDGLVYYEEPTTTKTLYPGDFLFCQVATAPSSSGTGIPFAIVEPIPDRPTNETQDTAV